MVVKGVRHPVKHRMGEDIQQNQVAMPSHIE